MERKRTKTEILARLQELLVQQEDLGGQLTAIGRQLRGELSTLRGGEVTGEAALRDIALEHVLDLLGRLAVAPTQADAIEVIIGSARQLLPSARGALCLGDGRIESPATVGVWGSEARTEAVPGNADGTNPPGRLAGRAPSGPTGEAIVLPINGFGLRLGELRVWPQGAGEMAPGSELAGRAELIARCAGLVLGGMHLRSRLQEQSLHDPLTGLFGQPYFVETLAREIARSVQQGVDLSLLIFDIDRFGQFNDRFGYDAGNIVLEAIAAAMLRHCQGQDLACRVSGERFALLVIGDADTALQRAQRLHAEVVALRPSLRERPLPGIRLSGGVASCPRHARDHVALMAAADTGLQLSRQAGGNRVTAATSAVSPQ